MTRCPMCKSNLVWNSDFDYEDYGKDGSGVVGSYSCPSTDCVVTDVDIFMD